MPISFNDIPANRRSPFFYAEVDPSKAGTLVINQPVLFVGHSLAAGTANNDEPVSFGSVAQAETAFGKGSMIARMVAAFFENNAAQEMKGIGIAEPGTGVAATGTVAIAAVSAEAGTIALWIAGQKVDVGVAASDTATAIGDAIEAAVNGATDLPVTASNLSGTVTLTAKWAGLTGNDINIRHSYRGELGGERLPGGVTLTITAMSGGTGTPDLMAAIATLGDDEYEHAVNAFTDTASLEVLKAEFGDSDNGRWGWKRQLYGHLWSAFRGTQGELTTFGNARNDFFMQCFGIEAATPSPIWEVAAAAAGQASRALLNDPARPLQTLVLAGVRPAPAAHRFTDVERETLLFDGIATQKVDATGAMAIQRAITMYQRNAQGGPDNAFLDVTTPATLVTIIRAMKQRITSKYGRHKVANDGTRLGPGQATVTPLIVKGELVALYRDLEFAGLVENVDAFKAALIVERDATDPTRMNVQFPPDLINPLIIFAVQVQFRLQFATTTV